MLQLNNRKILRYLSYLFPFFLMVPAHAGLIPSTPGGLVSFVTLPDSDFATAMAGNSSTDVSASLFTFDEAPIGTVVLDDTRSIVFTEYGGSTPGLYDNTDPGAGWWPNDGESFIGTHTREIAMQFVNMNVVGVQFLLAVSYTSATGWLGAYAGDEYNQTSNFGLNSSDGARGFGMYLGADAQSACSTIDQAIVDPDPRWGIAGIITYESTNPRCVSVPEPDAFWLFGLGLVCVVMLRRYAQGELNRSQR